MTVAYHMPVRTELAAKVGPRLWRKTILRAGHIAKNGYEVDIDRPYLETLVRNFTAGAMDSVPFQLADHLNRHNADPERTRGRLTGLELTSDDQLVGIFETTDDGTKLLEATPYLGCSVSIDPNFARADGRDCGPTLLHVAGTVDPEVSKLGEWVALSRDYDEVIDLSAPPEAPNDSEQTYADPGEGIDHANPGDDLEVPVASLTDEQVAKLLKLIEGDGPEPVAEDKNEPAEAEAGDEPEFTDAELDAMAAPAEEEAEEPQLVAASADQSDALELANARIDALVADAAAKDVKLSEIQRERDDERWKAEKVELARSFGIAGDIAELARPLLYGTDNKIELSNGKSLDAGQIMRKVLHELGRRYAKALDLGAEYGTADADDDTARRQRELDDFVARVNSERR